MVSVEELIIPLFASIAFTILAWFFLKLILKNSKKSGIIVSLFLILFFAYGHIFIYANGIQIFGFDTETHIHFVIPFIIIFGVGFFIILRSKRKLDNATKIGNAVSITLMITIAVNIGIFGIENLGTPEDSELDVSLSLENKIEEYPDIYYIILDGYANSHTLKNEYDFDNTDFINYLENHNFKIPSKTHGNYPMTFMALSASLNMKYLDHQSSQFDSTAKAQTAGHKLINNNDVMRYLKERGYKIINFDSGSWLTNSIKVADWHACGADYLNSEFLGMTVRTTMLYPLHVRLFEPDVRNGILCIFEELPNLRERTDQPIFVFAHIYLPHPPYIFGANGESVGPESLSFTAGWADRDAYTDQLQFANKKIKDVLDEMLSDEYSPIIIIQSDHGPKADIDYENPDSVMVKRLFGIFNSYHLPNGGNNEIYETITPVNSFRVVFNYYFDENFELLDDKAYYSNIQVPNRFDDVTSFLQE